MANDLLSLLQQLGEAEGTAPYEPSDALSKLHAEDLVKQQSLPGKTASQAAEVLAPKELPVPASEVYNKSQLRGAAKLANAAKGEVGKGIIELGEGEFKQLPALVENKLPAVVEKAGLPAVIKGAAPSAAKNLAKTALGVGSKALGAYGLVSGLQGELADPADFQGEPVPGMPGYIAKGPVIIPGGPQEPSIFQMASDAYGKHAADMMKQPEEKPAPDVPRMLAAVQAAEAHNQRPGEAKPDYLKDLLSKVYGDDLGDEALKEAQKRSSAARLAAGLTSAAMTGSHAISKSRQKLDTSFADETLMKQASAPVDNIIQRRKAKDQAIDAGFKISDLENKEKLRDPNSAVSKAYRSFALEAAPRLGKDPNFNNLNAAGVKELLPGIDMMMKLEMMKTQKAEKKKQDDDEDQNKRFGQLSKLLTSELAGSRTAFGKAMNTFASAEKLEKLVSGRNLDEVDTREVAEIARALDSILSSGNPTISGMKKLIPETARADAQKLTEYLTNERKGARLGSFLNQMMHTVKREKELANEQIKRGQGRILSGYSDLQQKNPERWGLIMRANDLPDDILDFKQKPAGGHGSKPKTIKQNGHTYTLNESTGEYE